jgi:outer membrane lipoprotein-sorting protein
MVMTSPDGSSQTAKIWYKNNKMRMEMKTEGETFITLTDLNTQTMYLYYPSQNTAMKMTYNPTESAVDETKGIVDFNPTILGTETLDGKVCLVVSYTFEGTTTKMWIWKQYGFPIRMEVTTSAGKSIIEYQNISLGDIADSMFVLPDGVQIIAF